MPTVYQALVNGNAGRICASLEMAFEHVAALMICPPEGGGLGEEVTHPWWTESLTDAGLEGSIQHRIIRSLRGMDRKPEVEFVGHDPGRAPGMDSQVEHYDIRCFDPSYMVQDALYQAAASEDDPSSILRALETRVMNGVHEARLLGQDDQHIVLGLITWQQRLSGPRVIQACDDPTAVLDGLPTTCANMFRDMFATVYPEEAHRLDAQVTGKGNEPICQMAPLVLSDRVFLSLPESSLTMRCIQRFIVFADECRDLGVRELPLVGFDAFGIHVILKEDGADEAGEDATLGDIQLHFRQNGSVLLNVSKGSFSLGDIGQNGWRSSRIDPTLWVKALAARQGHPDPGSLGHALRQHGPDDPMFLSELGSAAPTR